MRRGDFVKINGSKAVVVDAQFSDKLVFSFPNTGHQISVTYDDRADAWRDDNTGDIVEIEIVG